MKRSFLATMLLLIVFTIYTGSTHAAMLQSPPTGKIHENPDIPSIYSGGSAEMHKFISHSLQYPQEAAANNKQGLVVYTFVVEEDGTLSNFEIIHRADPQLNEEALRILKSMPPWTPARHNNRVVRSSNYVPMYFKLNKNAPATRRTSQTGNDVYAKKDEAIVQSEVYSIVDKMPQYPYGEKALGEFISQQIRYPIEARQEGIEGRIVCSFIVAVDGTISNIEVVKGIHPQLNREAMRVLNLMSKWTPGERNGEKVNVKCLLPIDFHIDETPIPTN